MVFASADVDKSAFGVEKRWHIARILPELGAYMRMLGFITDVAFQVTHSIGYLCLFLLASYLSISLIYDEISKPQAQSSCEGSKVQLN